ncbi:MAG: hypothetical protein MI867_28415 [Pseudomonadales bacterium]|nr:hypothetical protein [Pseudomonadales bacterium]
MLPLVSPAEIVVIVNKDNEALSLTKRQLVDLYMGRDVYFPNGNLAMRIDHSPDSDTRSHFYQKLVGKTVPEVNAYWARLLFTGRASPPHVIDDVKQILQMVSTNPNAIAYIDKGELDDRVSVLADFEF